MPDEQLLEELSGGKGGGGEPGTGAGGEMPRAETRFKMQEEQLRTFLNENGAIVAQQLVQGTQIRGESRVKLRDTEQGQRKDRAEARSHRVV